MSCYHSPLTFTLQFYALGDEIDSPSALKRMDVFRYDRSYAIMAMSMDSSILNNTSESLEIALLTSGDDFHALPSITSGVLMHHRSFRNSDVAATIYNPSNLSQQVVFQNKAAIRIDSGMPVGLYARSIDDPTNVLSGLVTLYCLLTK